MDAVNPVVVLPNPNVKAPAVGKAVRGGMVVVCVVPKPDPDPNVNFSGGIGGGCVPNPNVNCAGGVGGACFFISGGTGCFVFVAGDVVSFLILEAVSFSSSCFLFFNSVSLL